MSYSRTGTYSSRLSSTDNQLIGLAKSLKVYPGDTVNAKAYVRELAGTGGNINNLFTMLAQGFAGAFANTPIGLEGNLNSFSESLYPEVGTGGLMDKDDSDATPKLYLNMLYFDKDMNFITASFARSSSAATTGFEELNLEVVVPKEGYMLIYVSNEEEQANIAYFDDVNVTHKHSAVIQEESYYPFGMSQHYSYQRELTKEQRYTYNGKESITDLGLGWLDFGARMYDAALGRWFNIDPMAEKMYSQSTYNYAFNNPMLFVDPDGMFPIIIHVRSFVPTKRFVLYNQFAGDNRGFSANNSAKSRLHQRTFYDTDNPNQFNSTAEGTFSHSSYGAMGYSRGYVDDLAASSGGINTHLYGSNAALLVAPIAPGMPLHSIDSSSITPDIDIHSGLNVEVSQLDGGNQLLNISGNITGDAFPNAEAYVEDANGNTIFLGAFATATSVQTGMFTHLPGNGDSPMMMNINLSILTNSDGIFQGIQAGDKTISIDEWNKNFESLSVDEFREKYGDYYNQLFGGQN
ncbi:RHS repeat-associated core domain-containing protein [Marivirga lumbricoides]